MDQNTNDILETVNFIKDRMLTKDDVRDIIRNEVPQIVREETKTSAQSSHRSVAT